MTDDRTAFMSAEALTAGHKVLWYTIEEMLGQGGFGITYLAHDCNLDRKVAIKEYLPVSFAYRLKDASVRAKSGDQEESLFDWGLNSFLKEAQTLAKFAHPNIVRVHSVFQENSTAYMVMEYEHGDNLGAIYRKEQNLDQAFFERIFFPIFEGLQQIHAFGFIHRDIKPDNIYIRADGTPVLIDFGSARQTSQQQYRQMTALVSHGYTPLEQYGADYGDQGPWTDIYSLAATMYEGIAGMKPQESLARSAQLFSSRPDPLALLTPEAHKNFELHFLNAVQAGLTIDPTQRPRDLNEWIARFGSANPQFEPPPATVRLDSADDSSSIVTNAIRPNDVTVRQSSDSQSVTQLQTPDKSGSPKTATKIALISAGVVAVLAIAIGALMFSSSSPKITDTASQNLGAENSSTPLTPAKTTLADTDTDTGSIETTPIENASRVSVVNPAMLAELPSPVSPITSRLPQEHLLVKLEQLSNLAKNIQQAHAIDPDNKELMNSVDATFAELEGILETWNPNQFPQVGDKVRDISSMLPDQAGKQATIQMRIAVAEQEAISVQTVLALLEQGNIVQPVGNSVFDKVTQMSQAGFAEISVAHAWTRMMSTFKSAALDKISTSDFDGAARILETALTIHPGNDELELIRRKLQLR